MKTNLNNLSLAKKLTILTMGIGLIGLIATVNLVYFSITNLNKSILSDELNAHQNLITKSYVEPMWSFDKKQINEISNSLLKYNGFASMRALKVSDANGKTLFYETADNEDVENTFEDFAKMPFTQTLKSDILKNDEYLGTVSIAFSNRTVISKLQSKLIQIFIYSFIILLFINLCIYHFFNKLITLPFNKLLDHIKQIRNQNYETYKFSSMSHEMKLISNALNYTSHLIQKRNLDLQNQTENLEKMVAERTLELENQIVKNINASRLVAVGEVASGIAHEINNPLTVITGQVMKLKRQVSAATDPEGMASLEKINLMIQRIVKIINGLKLISRDGHADPMIEFSVPRMVEEIKLLTEMKIKSMNIILSVVLDPGVAIAFGREVQISQVLINLINNSVDAIATLDERWIKLSVLDSGDFLRFEITDSGHGIAQDLRDKILQPFFTTKEVGKGTGLGLSISVGIIKEHGGVFEYNPDCDNTQFVFSIYKSEVKKIAA